MSFEGLERKFFDEVMKLAKEQSDAEDVENARHREVRLAMKQISRLFGLAFPL
jgi:phage terminase Nu1 subunit (DNA packaging protein)